MSSLSENSSFINQLPDSVARPIQQGFVDSTHVVYILAGIVAVLALGLVLMMKEVPLRTKSALQEMQEEHAANAAADAVANAALNNAEGVEVQREIDDQTDELVSAGVDGQHGRHAADDAATAPPSAGQSRGKHQA